MQNCIVEVDKIRSYQTLVYKNGNKTFKKKAYTQYERVIALQIGGIKPIRGNTPIEVKLVFRSHYKVIGDADNITKPILDILQNNGKFENDRQIVDLHIIKLFGYKTSSIEIEIKECD
ncbi:MAG: RusA family crossover junction endodeoxyribonuclease [Coprobacillaceae bacterium]